MEAIRGFADDGLGNIGGWVGRGSGGGHGRVVSHEGLCRDKNSHTYSSVGVRVGILKDLYF